MSFFCGVLLVFAISIAQVSADQVCPNLVEQEQNLKWAQAHAKEPCTDEPTGTVFILIDGTELLSDASKKWVKTNAFSDDIIRFGEKGGEFIVALMGDKPVADFPMIRLCAPPKGNWLFTSPKQAKLKKLRFQCAVLETIPKLFLDAIEGAGQSFIAEAISEVFTNDRYRLKKNRHKRKFVLVSDLYQNSEYLKFYDFCKANGPNEPVTCPNYKDTFGISPKVAKYLKAATPKLRTDDEIYLYNTHVKGAGRIDQSAKEFWVGYFQAAGVLRKNIHYVPELDKERN